MQKIKESSIRELKDRLDAKALVENYVRLEHRGDKWWGCCPFHGEATPSFNLDAERGLYYCFGCNKGGSIIDFIMDIENLNFAQTIEFIAKKTGFHLQYENIGGKKREDEKLESEKDSILNLYEKATNMFNNLLMYNKIGKEALKYLKERGISEESIKKFRIGYAPKNRKWFYSFLRKKNYSPSFLAKSGLFLPKYPNIAFFHNRIMFPICDRYGSPIAFGARDLSGEGPKYINSKDMIQYKKGSNLFAFSLALQEIRKNKAVILCEGYMDVIAYHQAGINNAVAPLGTALTTEQCRYLRNLADVFYISFDSDEAGQKATYRAIMMLRKIQGEVYVINLENEKDPADILKNKGLYGLSLLIKNAILDVEYFLLLISNKFNLSTPTGRVAGLNFLFPYIATLSSGIFKEDVFRRLALFFHVSESSILSDYNEYLKKNKYDTKSVKVIRKEDVQLKKNSELRLLLSVLEDAKLFATLRSKVRLEDFESPSSKIIYIALEECFREGGEGLDAVMAKIEDTNIKNMIIKAIESGEFANNNINILNDGIKLIKINRLKKQRNAVVNKIRKLEYEEDKDREIRDLLMEKNELDSLILALKTES